MKVKVLHPSWFAVIGLRGHGAATGGLCSAARLGRIGGSAIVMARLRRSGFAGYEAKTACRREGITRDRKVQGSNPAPEGDERSPHLHTMPVGRSAFQDRPRLFDNRRMHV